MLIPTFQPTPLFHSSYIKKASLFTVCEAFSSEKQIGQDSLSVWVSDNLTENY